MVLLLYKKGYNILKSITLTICLKFDDSLIKKILLGNSLITNNFMGITLRKLFKDLRKNCKK